MTKIAVEKIAPKPDVERTARTTGVRNRVPKAAVQMRVPMTGVQKLVKAIAARKVVQLPTIGGPVRTHVPAIAAPAANSAGLAAEDRAACPARSVVRRVGLVALAAWTGESPRWSGSSTQFSMNCMPCAASEAGVMRVIAVDRPLETAGTHTAVPKGVASRPDRRLAHSAAAAAAAFLAVLFLRRRGAVLTVDGLVPIGLVPIGTAATMTADRLATTTGSGPIVPATGRRTCRRHRMTICPSNGNAIGRTDWQSVTLL